MTRRTQVVLFLVGTTLFVVLLQHVGIARLLDPKEGMRSREVPGGTGPSAVAQALARARERLVQMYVL